MADITILPEDQKIFSMKELKEKDSHSIRSVSWSMKESL